jgi:hypothetical protein
VALRIRAQFVGRGRSRLLLASLGALALSLSTLSVPAAQGAPPVARVAAKAPASTKGEIVAIAAVPHSSDVWAVGDNGGGEDNAKFFVARRHNGRWSRVKAPKLGGRYGYLDAITAASAKGIWIAGGRQAGGGSIQDVPAIWRWSGKKFVAQKLPGLGGCACAVGSISASSVSNVWAVGVIYGSNGQVALHWTGRKWVDVSYPEGLDFEGLTTVSTSGPTNAWATRSDGNLEHWDGKAWTVDGTEPAGTNFGGIATTSPRLAYAVGNVENLSTGSHRILLVRFNGKTWSNAPIAKGLGRLLLGSITMHGKSAWALGARQTSRHSFPMILHTTGGTWKSQKPSASNKFTLRSVSAVSTKRAYIGGYFIQGSEVRVQRTFFEAFNGHSWKPSSSKL